ncbi:MAG: phosphotransferase family protein [Granulosicoccus sp.]
MVSPNYEDRCKSLMASLGLCLPGEITRIEPLTGGVSSDIAAVSYANQTVCVKFALEKLRVEEDWFAPADRGRAEFAWLQITSEILPDAVPKLLGWSDSENGFAMSYIAGEDIILWKSLLLSGAKDIGQAESVANALALIHAQSTKPNFDKTAFDNASDFESLRIEPYLRFTAARHPDLAGKIIAVADRLSSSRLALVHGDISPKNILLRSNQPVFLDAECASMGDPAFDVAFCLNHLILKAIHLPESKLHLYATIQLFWRAYEQKIGWEPCEQVQARVVKLLPMLMLARVDGKSPVEYLTEESRAFVRSAARHLILTPELTISSFIGVLQSLEL